MAASFDRLRVRLIQIRERPAILAEEHASFCARTGLRPNQLVATSALLEPLDAALLDGIDAMFIGGAGAYSVTQTYGWTAALIALCRGCAERRLPLFGSCWGHQFIARAFGGTVVNDPTRAELGTHTVRLTEAGRTDPLFGTLPASFETQMGHHDRVSALPEGAVALATNDVAPNQAFRLRGLPIYGTQFHSELDAQAELDRLLAYRAYYPEMADNDEFDRIVAGVRPTPAADGLLRAFLDRFACA